PAAPVLGSSAALCAQATTIAPAIAAAIHRDTLPKDLMVVPPSRVPDPAVPWWPGAPRHSISRVDAARLKVLAREQSDAPHTRRVLFESLRISVVHLVAGKANGLGLEDRRAELAHEAVACA